MVLKNNSKWLFKYMPFNMRAIELLVNNQLWFGMPDTLNDPNEIEFILDFENNFEPKYRLEIHANDKLKKVIAETEAGQKLINGSEKTTFERALKESIRSYTGVCSFSEKYNNILMWSHYANANNGICIVFNKDMLIKHLMVDISSKVEYCDNMPHARYDGDENGGWLYHDKDFYIHKFSNWTYEEEYRFVRRYNNRIENYKLIRLEPFPPECIQGIIIGENFSENNLLTLKNILKGHKEYDNLLFWHSEKDIYKREMRVYPFLNSEY